MFEYADPAIDLLNPLYQINSCGVIILNIHK